ncbi:hypothetical protein [Actinomadura sp. NEAU-AAG7]|uniref:hypothetical protein n=1 Tax=Actinomadura sp. NEAU-AAG7 TaxID=2839640 RepID=UPI001BE4CAF4|nr:hypothetical protein [Actinomadura sp. NEAU-AAG7]MBT2207748.1 hypothetical protein [Actinomadura sp. NEAU-AAG7]
MFVWLINADNPARYGLVSGEEDVSAERGNRRRRVRGPGDPVVLLARTDRAEGCRGHVTIFVEVDDVETTSA